MGNSIQLLEIAPALKHLLMNAGFTIEYILNSGPAEIAATLGIELYVAKIIFDAAKKNVNERSFIEYTTMT